MVSWFDAVRYCNTLSELEGLASCYKIQGEVVLWTDPRCSGYRLPTEAEWEYAARADSAYEYAGSNDLGAVAWYTGNSEGKTHDVAKRDTNGWFLYDLSGNVWEWVWDSYSKSYQGTEKDFFGPNNGGYRVLRGGSCGSSADNARVALRNRNAPSYRDSNVGFRLARSFP